MLETLLSSAASDTLTIEKTLTIVAASLILGFAISLVYIFTHKKEGYSPSFTVTLIMLPSIIAIVILLIGNNVARAFSLAGAFSLIRFRSAPGDPKDIAYVFFTLAVGLACGMGYVGYGALFTLILCGVMVLLSSTQYSRPKNSMMTLKITIPEDLNYMDLFDDIFPKYTDSWQLHRVKTCDFGTLFNVSYRIKLKESSSHKDFLDELRCRNGNLDIVLTLAEFEDKAYL
ncbi:MAG: DUF4956 domain-containing protein [Eubacteriaceae bacterium]|nr:DUF4956 domain-containing protein [Eubacteriaceae bacterium]